MVDAADLKFYESTLDGITNNNVWILCKLGCMHNVDNFLMHNVL